MERNNMDKLALCALMGDQEAQTDLNEQYKLLPCPFCGGEASLFVQNGVRVICPKCDASSKILVDGRGARGIAGNATKAVVRAWNTRQPVPVFCKDCKYRNSCSNHIGETAIFGDYDFCSMGERKGDHETIDL